MSRQDKATTERNARVLRDLVKQPDNKACADCHKNDARWASWNLGVFLCIRCSGIHRAMGTHISKVKSIDLDIWTPEQMDNVQKWGNRRANLYWENHLKKGHNPPDHKIESFIRSKYESRRWAMEGPLPSDPSVLEEGGAASNPTPTQTQPPRPTPTAASPPPAAPGARPHPLLSRQGARPTVSPARAAPPPPAPAPIVDLFGDDSPAPAPTAPPTAPASRSPATTAAAAPAPAPATAAQPQGSNIFDLDFKAPVAPVKQQTAKADIMSLFSQAPAQPAAGGGFFNATATAPAANPYGSWNGGITSSATSPQQNTAPVPTWGGMNEQAAWGAPAQQTQQQQRPQQAQPSFNTWGSPTQQQQQPSNNSSGLWGQPAAADPWATAAQPTQPPAQKKAEHDPFANIWG